MPDNQAAEGISDAKLLAIVDAIETIDHKMECLLKLISEEQESLLKMPYSNRSLIPGALRVARDYQRNPTLIALHKVLQNRLNGTVEEGSPQATASAHEPGSKRWPTGSLRQLYRFKSVPF